MLQLALVFEIVNIPRHLFAQAQQPEQTLLGLPVAMSSSDSCAIPGVRISSSSRAVCCALKRPAAETAVVVAVAAAEMAGARLVRPFAALRNTCSRRRSAAGRVSNSAADTAGARQTDSASSSRRERGEGEGGGREGEGGGERGGGEGEGGGDETSPSVSASESGTAWTDLRPVSYRGKISSSSSSSSRFS